MSGWGLVEDHEAEKFGNDRVNVDANEFFSDFKAFGKVGDLDPLVFFAKGSDFGKGGLGDYGDCEFSEAAFAVFGELDGFELVVQSGAFVAIERSSCAQKVSVRGHLIVLICGGGRGEGGNRQRELSCCWVPEASSLACSSLTFQ